MLRAVLSISLVAAHVGTAAPSLRASLGEYEVLLLQADVGVHGVVVDQQRGAVAEHRRRDHALRAASTTASRRTPAFSTSATASANAVTDTTRARLMASFVRIAWPLGLM